MSPDTLFPILNLSVMPAWGLLAVFPKAEWTQRLVHAVWMPLLLAFVYLWLVFAAPPAPPGAGFDTLAGVMMLFDNPYGALAGWVHYLAFDLFVGAWEARDAARRGVSHVALLPALGLTLMLGPAGLLLYLIVRSFWSRDPGLAEA